MAEKKKATFTAPPFVSEDSLVALERARTHLTEAMLTTDPSARFASAHLLALRAAGALLAAAPRPLPARGRRATPLRSAWIRLGEADSDLVDWAALFASGAAKRQAIEAGAVGVVSERESFDLLHAADRFLAVVEQMLGLLPHRVTTAPSSIALAGADTGPGSGPQATAS